MSHYHDTEDLKALAEFKRLAPAEFKGSPRCWRPRLGPGPRPPTERSR